jgi:hypothetical protein
MMEQLRLDSRHGLQIFRLSKASRKTGVHTATNQMSTGKSVPEIKRPEHKADHWPPPTARVSVSGTTPPFLLSLTGWYSINPLKAKRICFI